VTSLCNFLEYYIDEDKGFRGKDDAELQKVLDAIFGFCYAWGLGSALEISVKERFDNIVRE
jgi:hypothetical protein